LAICLGGVDADSSSAGADGSQAQTANVSIGQGYTLVSPLQLAMAYVTIATAAPVIIRGWSIRFESGWFTGSG